MDTEIFARLNLWCLFIVGEVREVLDSVIVPEVALLVVEEIQPLNVALILLIHSILVFHGELISVS
jgi:hypothetical protein